MNSHVLTVPEGAVTFSGDSAFVFILTDSVPTQVFERRQIETGVSDGINIQVIEGIDTTAVIRGDAIKN